MDASYTFPRAINYAISSSSGNYSTTTHGSDQDVTNLSVTITTSGRPVILKIVPEEYSSNKAVIGFSNSTTGTAGGDIFFQRDGATIAQQEFVSFAGGATMTSIHFYPLQAFDAPAAGTYTYKVTVRFASSTVTASVKYVRLLVFEI